MKQSSNIFSEVNLKLVLIFVLSFVAFEKSPIVPDSTLTCNKLAVERPVITSQISNLCIHPNKKAVCNRLKGEPGEFSIADCCFIEELSEDPLTFEDQVNLWVRDICKMYPNVKPELVMSVIYHESRYSPTEVSSANCVGLMQLSVKWQTQRANRLGVTDLMDPYGNILVGVDLLSELLTMTNGDVAYALMCYNMGVGNAKPLYSQGIVSSYAKSVMSRQAYLEGVYEWQVVV